MPDSAPAPASTRVSWWSRFRAAWSVDGGGWFVLQAWGARTIPAWLEPPILFFYVSLFFWACPGPRRAVRRNLSAVFPGEGWLRLTGRAWLVFLRFGATATEAMQCRLGRHEVDWAIQGREHFDELVRSPGGAILLTAHMGSSDVAAPAFADRFPRRLTMVRAPQRVDGAQRRMRRQWEGQGGALEVAYNADEFLGADLVGRLVAGEAVALQGDRVIFDVSPMDVEADGLRLRLPKGPFALAQAARVPIFPLFVVRLGRLRYRVEVGEPFSCVAARERRQVVLEAAARSWMALLGRRIRRHWDQWYVFEPTLERAGAEAKVDARGPDADKSEPRLAETPERCATALGRALLTGWRWLRPRAPEGNQWVSHVGKPGQNACENALLAGLVGFTVWSLPVAWLIERVGWPVGWAVLAGLPLALASFHLAFFFGAGATALLGLVGLRLRRPSDMAGAWVLLALTVLASLAWLQGALFFKLAASPWLVASVLNLSAFFGLALVRLFQALSEGLARK